MKDDDNDSDDNDNVSDDNDNLSDVGAAFGYVTWRRDAAVLVEIGASVQAAPRDVVVEIPAALADAAMEAWSRTADHAMKPEETAPERSVRHRAGSLALIGCAVKERGHRRGDVLEVVLDGWVVGAALDAADDAQRINAGPSPVGPARGLKPPQFINVDLDLLGPEPFDLLASHLQAGDSPQGFVLWHGPHEDGFRISIELAYEEPTIAGTCHGLMRILRELPPPLRAQYDACTSRALDIGIEAGHAEPIVTLQPATIAAAGELGLGITLTQYPASVFRDRERKVRHHRLE